MNLEHWLGPSQTSPPLPLYLPLYARRFRQVASLVCRLVLGKLVLVEAPGSVQMESRKIILFANHPRLWDPLLLALLTGRFWPEHAVVAPIDEAAFRRHWYFRGLGFYGLPTSSVQGARRFLRTTKAALCSPEPCVIALTPEGKFSPPGQPLRLQRGLARALLDHRGAEVQAIPVALRYETGRQGAAVLLGDPLDCRTLDPTRHIEDLHEELTRRLQDAVDQLNCLSAPFDLCGRKMGIPL